MRKSAFVLLSVWLVIQTGFLSASAGVETVTSPPVVKTGWNLIALPAIPTQPDPVSVLDEYTPPDGSGIDGRMFRYNAATQSLVPYDAWLPELFGNALLTDGYWLLVPGGSAEQFAFEGITDNNTTDMWISLPKAGWALIGHPFSYSVDWLTVQVTDGTKTISMEAAAKTEDPAWLQSIGFWWNSELQGLRTLGLPGDPDWPESEALTPWHGYWIMTYKDNLALIVPASPPV